MGQLENKFSIKRIRKSSDIDYIEALKIYNETTPISIKTSTNEITYWIDQSCDNSPFELMVFVLYLDSQIIGFAMMSYLKSTKVVVIDYMAIYNRFRVNAVFFPFISLLQSYLNKNSYDVAYIVNEVSNKNEGNDIDRESKMFKKLFCLEGFGKIDAKYYTPPLGVKNYESVFDAHLYIKSSDNITIISKRTYFDIVTCIYKDYFGAWYNPLLIDEADKKEYVQTINEYLQKIEKSIDVELIHISYTDCPLLGGTKSELKYGVLPTQQKKRPLNMLFLALPIFICPLVIILVYTFVLDRLGIQISSVNTIIGSFFSAVITSISTITITKRKS